MTELLPCPWCGSDIRLSPINVPWSDKEPCWAIWHVDGTKAYEAKCPMEMGGYDTEAEAIEAWNTRAGCKDCAALNRAAGLWAKADKRARELERTCRMTPSDYYPCAEDDCMRLSMRMWTCSECEADNFGIKPNFCPFCGAKVVDA